MCLKIAQERERMNLKTKANYKEIEREIEKKLAEGKLLQGEVLKAEANFKTAKNNQIKAVNGELNYYLKTVDEVKTSEALLQKAKLQKSQRRIKPADLEAFQKAIKKEQDRTTREGMKEIKAAEEELLKMCLDLIEEQKKGTELYNKLYSSYKQAASDTEAGRLEIANIKEELSKYFYYSESFAKKNFVLVIREEVIQLIKYFKLNIVENFLNKE